MDISEKSYLAYKNVIKLILQGPTKKTVTALYRSFFGYTSSKPEKEKGGF